jgi:hypothetical protein
MYRFLTLTLMAGLLAFNVGCMTAAKRVLKEAVGASSEGAEVPGTVKGTFARYRGVSVGPVETKLGGLVSAKFKAALPGEVRKALATKEDAPFPGGSPQLTIRPEVMWFHDASGLGSIIGSDSYAVVLFQISGEEGDLGRYQIVTSSAASRTGDADMAKSMARELAKWIERRRGAKGKD